VGVVGAAPTTILVERGFEIQFVVRVRGQNWRDGCFSFFHFSRSISGGLILIELILQCRGHLFVNLFNVISELFITSRFICGRLVISNLLLLFDDFILNFLSHDQHLNAFTATCDVSIA
jgi:hypothetical protein